MKLRRCCSPPPSPAATTPTPPPPPQPFPIFLFFLSSLASPPSPHSSGPANQTVPFVPPVFTPPAWAEPLLTSTLCCSPLSSPFFPSHRQSVPSRCSREGARSKTAKPSPAHNTEGGDLPSAENGSDKGELAPQSRTQIPSPSGRGGEEDRRTSPGRARAPTLDRVLFAVVIPKVFVRVCRVSARRVELVTF